MTNGSFSEPFVLLGFVVESPEVYLLQIVGIPVRFAGFCFWELLYPGNAPRGFIRSQDWLKSYSQFRIRRQWLPKSRQEDLKPKPL